LMLIQSKLIIVIWPLHGTCLLVVWIETLLVIHHKVKAAFKR
jgi:hypothetical protein